MATVEEHYDRLLSDVYSWMYGGWDAALARYTEFFAVRGIAPRKSRRVVDLGAGCGFQAIPLARLRFQVTAIDLDRKLLAELQTHAGGEKVHDLVYRRVDGHGSSPELLPKLRLSTAWVVSTLRAVGFRRWRRLSTAGSWS